MYRKIILGILTFLYIASFTLMLAALVIEGVPQKLTNANLASILTMTPAQMALAFALLGLITGILFAIASWRLLVRSERFREELSLAATRARKANERLDRLNRHKDTLLAVSSHDLKNPVTTIKFALAFLEDRMDLPPDGRKMLRIIRDNTERMEDLLADLSDLTQIERGSVSIHTRATRLEELLLPCYDSFKLVADQKGITLRVNAPGDVPLVLADPAKVGRVLENFLSNAIKFTPTGGEVRLEAWCEEAGMRLSVTDNGIGFSQDLATEIFHPFSKAQRRGTAGEKGTGLGLSITREILRLHGCEIKAESSVGKGSVFSFTLPFAPTAAREGKVESSPGQAAAGV